MLSSDVRVVVDALQGFVELPKRGFDSGQFRLEVGGPVTPAPTVPVAPPVVVKRRGGPSRFRKK